MMESLPPAVRELLSQQRVVSVRGMKPGISGANVFRCETNGGDAVGAEGGFALKCWPAGTKPDRVREVHSVQQAAVDHGCQFVPRLVQPSAEKSFLVQAKRIWELCSWMPGAPLPDNASLQHIRSGAKAIAKFHCAARTQGHFDAVAPAVVNRLKRASELTDLLPKTFCRDINPGYDPTLRQSLNRACQLLQNHWPRIDGQIQTQLRRYASSKVPVQYVLRDVHREHVLFHDEDVSGLIDFDAVRVDTIAADLVRWGGSFLVDHTDRHTVWNQILAGYASVLPSVHGKCSDEQMAFLDDLHLAGTWISIGNWAVWLRLECRTFGRKDSLIAGRVDELVQLACQYL